MASFIYVVKNKMSRPKKKTIAEMTDEEILDALSNFVNLPPVNRVIFTRNPKYLFVMFR
jgi:hypothetical protein